MFDATMSAAVEVIRVYERALARLEGLVLTAPYLVECEGIPVTFDVDDHGDVLGVRPCMPHLARSFSWRDAGRLASAIANGNGVAGTVIHVRDAIERALDAERAVVETLLQFGRAGVTDDAGTGHDHQASSLHHVMAM